MFLPCVTKPPALNLTIFLFVDIDLTSFMGNLSPANFHNTNTSLHLPTNAHSNFVSDLEKKEKSVDGENRKTTTLDSDDKDLA